MELKFNSQVCTNIEQSKKLLELGLKPETADFHYLLMDENWSIGIGFWKQPHQNVPTHYIPAWSLHRLIELWFSCNKQEDCYMVNQEDAFDNIITDIGWYIKYNFFNKEYLNK